MYLNGSYDLFFMCSFFLISWHGVTKLKIIQTLFNSFFTQFSNLFAGWKKHRSDYSEIMCQRLYKKWIRAEKENQGKI